MRGTRVVLKVLFVAVSLACVSARGAAENPMHPTAEVHLAQAAAGFDLPHTTYARYMRSTKPPQPRSPNDWWLMALVAVTLVGHQMRRKHRFLRPHPFGF
jgi:hypothetical protein